ncbi:hypothetical protein F5884DRAFT_471629 [Xylogone sp. PMI_703]|nr:hypothetical protein F5884DRAFT_471629 [Xylogone sp. PMI_703]
MPTPVIMPVDLEKLLLIPEGDDDLIYYHYLYEAAAGIANIIGSLTLSTHKTWVEYKINVWAFGLISHQFINMVRQENPRALVILAYYLVLLSYLPDVWLYKGVADHDIPILEKMVNERWREYLHTPRKALQFSNRESLTEFLISLSAGSNNEDPLLQPLFLSPPLH